MRYSYKCKNTKCVIKVITVTKPMSQCSRVEYCNECGDKLERVYNTVGIVTGDGCKS